MDARLIAYAIQLGGEVVDGTYIRCPSPGRAADDRTCRVQINSTGFFIYDCVGSLAGAYAMVRTKLKLKAAARTTTAMALKTWDQTQPASGTSVQTYLVSRAITVPPPLDVRFHPSLRHRRGLYWPAMVCARRDAAGKFVAAHRTFLQRNGGGKAPIDPNKMDLGPPSGTAIRLAPVAAELAVTEGIETGLSVMQHTGLPTWAAGSAPMIRLLVLPLKVRSVLICADGDREGLAAAHAAAARWRDEGRRVQIYPAPEGKDFNDLLMEQG